MNYFKKFCDNFLIISIILFPKITFSSQYFSPSLIIGTNVNRIELLKSNANGIYDEYEYPLGYLVGISNETFKINNTISLYNDLYYEYKRSKMHLDVLSNVNPIYENYNSHYLRISLLLGINFYKNYELLLGYDIARLIKLEINMDDFEDCLGKFNPKNYSKFDNTICCCIGKKFKIRQQQYMIELKYLFGLNEYKYFDPMDGKLPSPTRNHSVQLVFGYKLKF